VNDAALSEPTLDIEDSVLNQAALISGADCIVNAADFSGSSVGVSPSPVRRFFGLSKAEKPDSERAMKARNQ